MTTFWQVLLKLVSLPHIVNAKNKNNFFPSLPTLTFLRVLAKTIMFLVWPNLAMLKIFLLYQDVKPVLFQSVFFRKKFGSKNQYCSQEESGIMNIRWFGTTKVFSWIACMYSNFYYLVWKSFLEILTSYWYVVLTLSIPFEKSFLCGYFCAVKDIGWDVYFS